MSPASPSFQKEQSSAHQAHSRQDSLFDTDSPTEEEEFVYEDNAGDYAKRLEEVLSESDGDGGGGHGDDDDDDDDEGFVYEGKDAEPVGTYRDQLREVLSDEDDESFQYPEGETGSASASASAEEVEQVEGNRSLKVVVPESESVVGSDVGQVS